MRNSNEIFKKNVSYDILKATNRQGFIPSLENRVFGKTEGSN